MRRSLLLGLTALLGAGGGATAWTATLTVSLTVNAACLVDANDLIFGTVNPLSGSPTDGAAALSVTCTNTTPYQVALDAGANGTFATRAMASGGNLLDYNLYTENSYTTIWGDGTSSTSTMGATGDGDTDSYTIYANMPASQSLIVGSYSDTVTATISY